MTELEELEELEKAKAQLMARINELRTIEADKENAAYVGKYFKYRNCYSCPETEKDYWWMYIKILKSVDGVLYTLEFQIDNKGRIEITPEIYFRMGEEYIEIPESEFLVAWDLCVEQIQSLI